MYRWLVLAGVLGKQRKPARVLEGLRVERLPLPSPDELAEAPVTIDEAADRAYVAAIEARREVAGWNLSLSPAEAAECYHAMQAGFSAQHLANIYGVTDPGVIRRAVKRVEQSRTGVFGDLKTQEENELRSEKLRALLQHEQGVKSERGRKRRPSL